jgi:hypothetical protein
MERPFLHRIRWANVALAAAVLTAVAAVLLQSPAPEVPPGTADVVVAATPVPAPTSAPTTAVQPAPGLVSPAATPAPGPARPRARRRSPAPRSTRPSLTATTTTPPSRAAPIVRRPQPPVEFGFER